MTIGQGFNRLGVSVAIAFLGLSVVSLCFAASGYWRYSTKIEYEIQRRIERPGASASQQAAARAQLVSSEAWSRFTNARFRSVDRALDLAGLCVLASMIAFLFWNAVGWVFMRFEAAGQEVEE